MSFNQSGPRTPENKKKKAKNRNTPNIVDVSGRTAVVTPSSTHKPPQTSQSGAGASAPATAAKAAVAAANTLLQLSAPIAATAAAQKAFFLAALTDYSEEQLKANGRIKNINAAFENKLPTEEELAKTLFEKVHRLGLSFILRLHMNNCFIPVRILSLIIRIYLQRSCGKVSCGEKLAHLCGLILH